MAKFARLVMGAALIALLALLGPGATVSAQAPNEPTTGVTLTLSIDYFERFEVPDDGIDEEGEFFPEIKIGDGAVQRRGPIGDDKFHPWTTEASNPTIASRTT